MNKRVIIECMQGLGDTVYHRPLARKLLAMGHDVYVRSAWPQLWSDLPVKLLPFDSELPVQKANVNAFTGEYSDNPDSPYLRIRPTYGAMHFAQDMSIMSALYETSGLPDGAVDFTLPLREGKKTNLAIVHPPVIREEWRNVARPNDPKYMQLIIDNHPEFDWVEVRYPGEMLYGEPLRGTRIVSPPTTEQLVSLLASAVVIVTCPGFMIPLGIALRTPTLALYGGDLPDRLLVDKWMLGAPYEAVEPKPFCACGISSRHREDLCNRTLDPREVLAAFKRVGCASLLDWRGEYGYYPVHVNGQYDKGYFENYHRLEQTDMGHKLNEFRVDITHRHFAGARLLDIGPGACTFVKATSALGLDINPATIEELKRLGRYQSPELLSYIDVATFWDSLEHISLEDLEKLFKLIQTGCVVSMPIYDDRDHVLRSRHFKPAEHMHYWTDQGFVTFMESYGFRLQVKSDFETRLGREGIMTYVFVRT